MLPCVCSGIDQRRHENVVRTSVTHSAIASCATFLFLPHFDIICDLLLNRRTATWNLFVKYIVSTTLLTLLIAVVHESVSLVVSRQILTELCNHIPNMESSTAKEVSHFVLDKLQPRAISFEEQVSADGMYKVHFCAFLLWGVVV